MMLPFICSYRNKNEPTAIYPSMARNKHTRPPPSPPRPPPSHMHAGRDLPLHHPRRDSRHTHANAHARVQPRCHLLTQSNGGLGAASEPRGTRITTDSHQGHTASVYKTWLHGMDPKMKQKKKENLLRNLHRRKKIFFFIFMM